MDSDLELAWCRPLQTRPLKTSNRKQVIILLAVAVFFLLAILVSQTAFDLTLLRPGNNQQIVVFYALSLLISLLFVALTFVLARNLLKLFRRAPPGSVGLEVSPRAWWRAHYFCPSFPS